MSRWRRQQRKRSRRARIRHFWDALAIKGSAVWPGRLSSKTTTLDFGFYFGSFEGGSGNVAVAETHQREQQACR